ncbi:lytic murein transglycosylase [Trinickia caryophylli]|uniref:Lytic murein transglycosylase n=2 Tax=Trinickia caryophylli TaxID=28094 RepID=A0A1X7D4T0_TRICW|nr:lytic murein transglycosylase [Trinickia caryophylli]TRX15137.1 lytic murein transglycosylase [Trinickia caryophylli]SMF08928.1 lytic murein transglycosylase [Trinickia caryophylli]
MKKQTLKRGATIFSLLTLCMFRLTTHGQAVDAPASNEKGASATESGPSAEAAVFDAWRASFRAKALAKGIPSSTFDYAFDRVTPDPDVVDLDRRQPEFTTYIWDYLNKRVTPENVQQGNAFVASKYSVFQTLERDYGVNKYVLAAILGIESQYGSDMGQRYVVRSLATLANDGPRKPYAEAQLLASLQMLQEGDVQRDQLVGSWAGAMGQTQFIPTTYLQYAVDGDGDRKRDIWHSSADALASTANYLEHMGWQRGEIWGMEVQVPKAFDYEMAALSTRKSVAEWQAMGVIGASGPISSEMRNLQASIILPAGYRGPKFLVLNNYRAILKYNASTAYALAVALLADSYVGKGKLVQPWPTDDPPLNNVTDIALLQQKLTDQGYDPGAVDGVIGDRTQKAVRAYQKSQHLVPDGYVSTSLFARLQGGPASPGAGK